VQCFVKRNFTRTFETDKLPKLLYACKAEVDLTKLPCVMQMHEDRLEILFIRHGRGIHTIDGRQYQTQEGDILIFNSGVIHDERANPQTGMSVYNCAVTNLKLEGMRENCLIIDGANPVLRSGALRKDIESLFSMIYSQLYSQNGGAEEISNHLLCSLITIILKQVDGAGVLEVVNEDMLGKNIKRYIDEHCFEDLTLECISRALHISPSHLCNVFKKTTGYAPIQYITCRRIGKAQSLLLGTKYSATTIATMVGYDNSNYFNTIFTKIVGMTPIKYRKRWVDKAQIEEQQVL
jgi:AraC-like DNA-binding protein/mannose-6-phosphate isomerase-like protein (cupin superfamily)